MTIYARKGQLVKYIGDPAYAWGGSRAIPTVETALVVEDDVGDTLCLLHWDGDQNEWRSLKVSTNWRLVDDQA